MTISSPIPFREALQSRAVKRVLPTNASSAEIMGWDVGIRERASFSAKTTIEEVLQEYGDAVGEILNPQTVEREGRLVTEGLDMATARLRIKQLWQRLGYEPDPDKRGSIEDLSSDKRIDLKLKMDVEFAQGYGAWRQGQDPDALDAFPAQELYRLEEREKPRDWISRWQGAGGQLYDGRMIALKNDPVWEEISAFGQPYPPFDFNSGMWVRDVDREEAVKLGLIGEDEQLEPESRGFELEAPSEAWTQ